MNDIDAAETKNWNSGKGWDPIGVHIDPFEGSFDGHNYTISNLFIDRPDESRIGLFGNLGSFPKIVIENVELKDSDWTGSGGGILIGHLNRCGVANQKHEILNCRVSGKLTGDGQNEGRYMGGLIGFASGDIIITNCSVDIEITGHSYLGGLVGHSGADIKYCHSNGSIEASYTNVGGLIGRSSGGEIERCYSEVDISADEAPQIGRLIGQKYSGKLRNCYATGDITHNGSGSIGGLVGSHYNETYYCYSIGAISPDGSSVGGLIGTKGANDESYPNFCYWDMETSGQDDSDGGHGKTTSEMKDTSTYLHWDFTNIWIIDSEINNGYPALRWFYEVGSPTLDEPEDLATNIGLKPSLNWQSVSAASWSAPTFLYSKLRYFSDFKVYRRHVIECRM